LLSGNGGSARELAPFRRARSFEKSGHEVKNTDRQSYADNEIQDGKWFLVS